MEKFDNKNYPNAELTREIIRCAFLVYKQLGYGLPEKVYQKAMAEAFSESGITYHRECYGLITFNNKPVGKYFLDFLVDNKIAVELKVRNEVYESDTIQLLNYIKSKKLPVGILLVFTKREVRIKRLANTNQR